MDNKMILKLLNEEKYAELKKAVLQEMAIKDSKNINVAKGILALSKMAKKEMLKANRPALAGAYYDFGKTQITNAYWLYINNSILSGIEEAIETEAGNRPDFEKHIDFNAGTEITLNREALSNAVAEKQDFAVDDVYFNAVYVSKLAKCFDPDNVKVKLENNGGYGKLIFIAPDSRGVVLSLRKGV